MDWNLFWSAFGAIGGTLGAVATTAAVVVALWQTKYSQKKIIKLAFSDNFQLYNPNTGESAKFIGISVTNTGNRKVIIRTWGVHLKEGSAIVTPPLDANGIEKMAYTKLPQTLDLEESIDLQWQKDKFQLFLEANVDNIEKSKPLVFYVNDSTGKQYTVKTKNLNEKLNSRCGLSQ